MSSSYTAWQTAVFTLGQLISVALASALLASLTTIAATSARRAALHRQLQQARRRCAQAMQLAHERGLALRQRSDDSPRDDGQLANLNAMLDGPRGRFTTHTREVPAPHLPRLT